MGFPTWLRLLARNRFAIAPHRVPMALFIAFIGMFNSLMSLAQRVVYGRRIECVELKNQPIFIIGHWRTGTTLLHELLALDERHTCPDWYQCFAPSHFLVTRGFIVPWLRFLIPSRRPTDNMRVGFDSPQEDELALCNMGIPSPYLTIAFPNRPPQFQEYLDLQGLPPDAMDCWKGAFVRFLKSVALKDSRRLVLKSPAHTFRIKTLLEIFPDARFVHIVRDPYVVFPSTVNLWKRLYRDQGLQEPRYAHLEERVFETFRRMYEAFERDRELLAPGRLCEVSYENLVADPMREMRRIYEDLGLGSFNKVLPALKKKAGEIAGHRTNAYEVTPTTRAAITRRCRSYIETYGYARREERLWQNDCRHD